MTIWRDCGGEVRIVGIFFFKRRRDHVFDCFIGLRDQIRRVLLGVNMCRVGGRDHVPCFEGELEEEIVDFVQVGGYMSHGG